MLRKKHANIKIVEPVYVFLTAYMTPQFKVHSTNMGIQHYYEKPI